MIKIGLASDHAGFELKEFVKKYIEQKGYIYKDFGAYTADSSDYPDYAHPLAMAVEAGKTGEAEKIITNYELRITKKEITEGKEEETEEAGEDQGIDLGIAMCGSGNGIAMTLNKHQGIRAAICWNTEIARVTRAHNDANILVLPARFISREEVAEMINIFLNTPFEGGRHQRRVEKIGLPKELSSF